MPRLGLGSLELSSLGGTGQDVVTTIDDFFFESDTSGEVTPIYTASRKQFVRNNNDVAGLNNVTKDTSITVPPGQTGTAIRLTEDTTTSQHFATAIIDEVTAGDTYTMSLYVKSTYSSIVIYTNTTQISSNVTVNFTNGTISTSALRAGIEDAGGGWYRINWTQVAQASADSLMYLVVKDLSSYTGSTSNFTDYFGIQVEQDSRASSFMLNTTNDVLTVATTLNDTSEVWDFDSTDIMLEADPEDEGFWEEGSNLVLNHDYEELGSELVTNGTFDADSDWTKGTGWSISDGTASISESGAVTLAQSPGSALVSGKTYKVVYTISGYSGSGIVKVQFTGGSTLSGQNRTANGTHTEYLTATANHTTIRLKALSNSGGFTGSIDNFSVKQVDPNDRWTLTGGTSISDGKMTVTGASGTSLGFQSILVQGTTYELTYTISNFSSSSGDTKVIDDNANTIQNISANGTFTVIFTHAIASSNLIFRATNGTNSYQVDNVTVTEYAIQPQDV